MQLTDQQLDAAARKLCELWKSTRKEYVPHDMAKQHIALVCLEMEPTIDAIIHAVTREQKDEVRE